MGSRTGTLSGARRPGRRRRRAPRLAAPTLTCLLIAACGAADPAGLSPADLGLTTAHRPPVLASTTVYTSPDGGIYRNPDNLRVIMAAPGALSPLDVRLETASEWRPLARLGGLTYVGIRVRNDGKGGSDLRLNDLQVASDLAPDGTATGPLRHFYHPTYPLAALGDGALGGDCTVHLDPGQSTVAVLTYPPLRSSPRLTWGRYRDFSLEFGWGGGLPPGTVSLTARLCTPPPAGP